MREICGLDLTQNELKVWLAYRAEMDEATRQVRGKGQDRLRELTGLGRTQFSVASGNLQRRGLISAFRQRNAPQIVTVADPKTVNVESQAVRETRTFGSSEVPNSGRSEVPNSGRSGNPNDDSYYTAPVSTPESSTRERDADRPMPSHVKPVTDWSKAFARPEDNLGVIVDPDGRVRLDGQARAEWLVKFKTDDRLDLALDQVVIQRASNVPVAAQVRKQLASQAANKLDRKENYDAAVRANAKPKVSKSGNFLSRY